MEELDVNASPNLATECDSNEATTGVSPSCSLSIVRVKLVSEINNDINESCAAKRKLDTRSTEENQDEISSKKSKDIEYENSHEENATSSSVANAQSEQSNTVNCNADEASVNLGTAENLLALNPKQTENEDPCSSSADAGIPAVLIPVKTEPVDQGNSSSEAGTSTTATADIKLSASVKKEEATSTSRESCKFGIRCYRRNPMHRIEEAHPGDHDYKRPCFPTPPLGTPDCPYGDACYRRNPSHFEHFNHPPETDFEQNWKNYRSRLRQRRQITHNDTSNGNDSSDLDDYDMEDPFIDDGDLDEDYAPSGNDDDDDEEYDECDKAEE